MYGPGSCPCVTSTSHAVRQALGFIFSFELLAPHGEEVDAANCKVVDEMRAEEFISTEFSDAFVAADVLEVGLHIYRSLICLS